MTRRDLARAVTARNRRLAIEARPLVMGDWPYLADLTPVERAHAIRQAARTMVAGGDSWALVWIRRARRCPEVLTPLR